MGKNEASRKLTYSVDQYTLANSVMPEVGARLNAAATSLAQARGLKLERKTQAYKMSNGHPVPGLFNMTWSARNGLKPGFTVAVEHSPANYLNVEVKATPWYPVAVIIALVIGSLISYLYVPWLLADFSRRVTHPLIIVGIVIVFILALAYIGRSLILCGLIAIASSLTFGFIIGAAIGWGIAAKATNLKHGEALRPGLMEILARMDAPISVATAGAYGAAPGYSLGPPTAASPYYAPAPPSQAPARYSPLPPSAAAVYATPFPPMQVSASYYSTPVPAYDAPALSNVASAPCPTCATPVVAGASSCASCGLELVWD